MLMKPKPRTVNITVTSTVTKQHAVTYGYPAGKGRFYIPLYKMIVEGDSVGGVCETFEFEVMRFGVQWKYPTDSNPSPKPKVVGLAKAKTYKLNTMITTAGSECWQIEDNHLLHSGSRTPMLASGGIGAVIGCIAVTGQRFDEDRIKSVSDWKYLNDLIYRLSGTYDRIEITRAGSLIMKIEAADYPKLREAH